MPFLTRGLTALVAAAAVLGGCANGGERSTERGSATPSASGGSSSPRIVPPEELEVMSAFESYRQALIDRDGAAAAAAVAEPTVRYYGDMAGLALTGTKTQLLELPILDALSALFLRRLATPDQLEKMSGEDVIEFAVEKGLITKAAVAKVEPTRANVLGDTAALDVEVAGGPAPFSYTFRLEADGWKLDLTELADLAEAAFREQMDNAGLPKDEYVLLAVKATSGTKPSKYIWQPPRP